MRVLWLAILVLLTGSVIAGETEVYHDVEKVDDGFEPQSGPRIAVTADSLIWVQYKHDIGNGPCISYMNGLAAGAFSDLLNFENDGEGGGAGHLWADHDTLYCGLSSTAPDSQYIYKFYGGSEVCADVIYPPSGSSEVSNFFVGGWGDGDSWVGYGKSGTTTGIFRTLADGQICDATEWAGTSTVTIQAGEQEDHIFVPSESGMLIFHVDSEEMTFFEADGTVNTQVIDPCFANVYMAAASSAQGNYADMGSCPGSLDGTNDTSYWAITDETSRQVQIYTIVSDASAGTASITDSSGVITTGTKPTGSSLWYAATNPHIVLAGDGMILVCRDWADASGAPETARAAWYVIDDRSDLTQSWTKHIVTPTAGATGHLSAPWALVDYNHADSSSLVWAWTVGTAYTQLMLTDVTIETPSASAPADDAWGGYVIPVTIQ